MTKISVKNNKKLKNNLDNKNIEVVNNIILNYLKNLFPNPKCELNFETPFQLLVAVILSAQCTDKRVNDVTKKLFEDYKNPIDFAKMSQSELENKIFSCGFYHNKAKNIISASSDIINKYNGEVPNNVKDLESLAGVGRKTANVVYSTVFNGNAIAVDTHVFRVSNRLGIVNAKTPKDCEKQLMQRFAENFWSLLHYQLVLFGRYYCKARNPKCSICGLKNICKYYKQII